MRDKLLAYLKNSHHYWWTVSVLPGVLAITYLYQNNLYLVNSWEQLAAFVLFLIILPGMGFLGLDFIVKRLWQQHRPKLYYSVLLIHLSVSLSLIYFS